MSVAHAAEGLWIGDLALLSDVNRIVSIIAIQECTFVYLPGTAIKTLLAEKPRFWPSFYELSARNTTLSVALHAENLSLTVRARVCRMLLRLSKDRLEAEITQEALARTLGIARPTLRRCLLDLAAQGAIETKYRRLRILDKSILKRFESES